MDKEQDKAKSAIQLLKQLVMEKRKREAEEAEAKAAEEALEKSSSSSVMSDELSVESELKSP